MVAQIVAIDQGDPSGSPFCRLVTSGVERDSGNRILETSSNPALFQFVRFRMFTVIYGSKSFALQSGRAASLLRRAHIELVCGNAEGAESLKAEALAVEVLA